VSTLVEENPRIIFNQSVEKMDEQVSLVLWVLKFMESIEIRSAYPEKGGGKRIVTRERRSYQGN